MYPKSPLSQGQAPTTAEDNIRGRINRIAEKVASIHGHLDGVIESTFGPKPAEAEPNSPQGSSYVSILDNIDYRLRKIDEALEFLSARL